LSVKTVLAGTEIQILNFARISAARKLGTSLISIKFYN